MWRVGQAGGLGFDIYALLRVKQKAKWEPAVSTGSSARCSAMSLRGVTGGGKVKRERIYIYTLT